MAVLGEVEDVVAWWNRIAGYWLRKEGQGTLLALAKQHAKIQCVKLPPQPTWPRKLKPQVGMSTYLQAVMKTMKQNKQSVLEPPLKKVRVDRVQVFHPPTLPHGNDVWS